MSEEATKLKPVIFEQGKYNYHRQDDFRQKLLLQALTITQDPEELRKMAGFKRVADVYRTLDKMAIRKEYHEALARKGISFDKIIEGVIEIAEGSGSDKVRLAAYQTFMKSLGVDKYEDATAEKGADWEEALLRAHEQKELEAANKPALEAPKPEIVYEVTEPPVPEEEKEAIEREQEIGRSLYED